MPTKVIIGRKSGKSEIIDWDNVGKLYEISENSDYFLDVEVEDGDRVYLEGLEQKNNLQDYVALDNNNEIYIKKSCRIYFYDIGNSENAYVPGYYKIKYKERYSWIKINPKFIDDDEYGRMVSDLEQKVMGLSQTYIRGKHGAKIVNDKDTDNHRIDILIKNFNTFQESIFRIISNPRSEIGSEYRWSSKNDVGMDYRSTIKMSSNPQKNKRYLKRHIVNYNTRGNIFLKHCILEIRNISKDLYGRFHKYIGDDAKQLKMYITLIDDLTLRSWLNNVSSSYLGNNQMGSTLMNYSYNFIINLDSELKSLKSVKNAKKDNLAYYNKSSQQLYELWGFIEVIKGFERLKYKYVKGLENILNENESLNENIRDGFKDGTSVILKKVVECQGKKIPITAKIIYNQSITRNHKNKQHIFTPARHNKPDIRIDLFNSFNTYIGSTIVDTKYRDKSTFLKTEDEYGSRYQLKDYLDSIRSDDIYDSEEFDQNKIGNNHGHAFLGVNFVGVMYPGSKEEEGYKSITNPIDVIMIKEKPGENLENIDKFLKYSINDWVQNSVQLLK